MIFQRSLFASCLALALFSCFGRGPEFRPAPPQPPETEGLLRTQRVAFFPSDELAPSVSSTGRWIAFVSDETGNLDLWIKDLRTDSPYPITRDAADDTDPAFGPRSDRLLFVSRRSDAKGDIYLTDVEGGGLKRLTFEATADRQPVFAPDERSIYFTTATPVGLEFVSVLELDGGEPRRVSPTSGFDPAPAPDGRYLVYTAPGGTSGRRYPHLVALRLADTATRALTSGDSPAGFARFARSSTAGSALFFVRFPDDDDGDGVIDGSDQASLWTMKVELDALFEGAPDALEPPFPLTTGAKDELFPEPAGDWLYFTETARLDQDVVRLPIGGMFPRYASLDDYIRLANASIDPRERWFSYRALLARSAPDSLLHARALLGIANTQVEAGQPQLAEPAFAELERVTEGAADRSDRSELNGLAKVELLGLARKRELDSAATPMAREQVLRGTQAALEQLATRFLWAPRVLARIDLELAEVTHDRGDRLAAISAFDQVAEKHQRVPYSAARAMIRRTELLGVAFDPDALGEAYAQVLRRFPGERWLVAEAAERTVDAQVQAAGTDSPWQNRADAIRRILLRSGSPPVRFAARRRLVELYTESEKLDLAARELDRLVVETSSAGDRLLASTALAELARVEEQRGALDEALARWNELRRDYGELPGVGGTVRDAITRVALRKAAEEQARGRIDLARASYRAVLDNDPTQVRAHRRYLELSARAGELEAAIEEARQRRDRSPRTPIFRYAYALALTWTSPPRLSEARKEIEATLELNPQFGPGYVTRGWIHEMLELEAPDEGHLEKAIEDYGTAARLNSESADREAEAEISLNLGNAKWRLADRTNDAKNFSFAFKDYLEFLALGGRFRSLGAELVFWERLGRAASWEKDWAVSAMASREALRLMELAAENEARSADLLASRRAQLWGNLALAYGQAGENAYAEEAFDRFQAELEARNQGGRMIIARRNLATSKLRATERSGSGDLDGALRDLAFARQKLVEAGRPPLGDYPSRLQMTVPDATRAPFGFEALAELDLNLALASDVHRARGDLGRARAIDQNRDGLLDELFDQHQPLTLNVFREKVGLTVREARASCREGQVPACAQRFSALLERLDDASEDEALARDRPSLRLERARVVAIAAEEEALLRSKGVFEPVLPSIEGELAAVEDEARTLAAVIVPDAETATVTAADTSSVALELLPAAAGEVHTRLLHARGLLALAGAEARAEPRSAELTAVLAGLDAAVSAMAGATASFREAAEVAAKLPEARRSRLLSLALHGLAESSRRSGLPAPAEEDWAEQAALGAEAMGASQLALRMRIAGALAGSDQAVLAIAEKVAATLPALGPDDDALLGRLASRTASIALGRSDVITAFGVWDRHLLRRAARGPLEAVRDAVSVEDRALLSALHRAIAERAAVRARLDAPPSAARARELDDRTALEARLVEADQKLAAVRDLQYSPALGARIYGEAWSTEDLPDELAPAELLLMPVDLDGRLLLFFADGSTTAAERVGMIAGGGAAGTLASAVADARLKLASGAPVAPEASRAIEAALITPIRERLSGKRTLILADAVIGGPVPLAAIIRDLPLGLAHVSAPSAYVASKAVARLGAEGVVRIAGLQDGLHSGGDTLTAADAKQLATEGSGKPEKDLNEARSLEARSKAERHGGRAHALLVIEPEVKLEPGALERSTVLLEPPAQGAPAAEHFAGELPLASLSMSAAVLVLGRVAPGPTGGGDTMPPSAVLGLDVALAPLGFATTLSIPAAVPIEAARRIVDEVAAESAKIGAALALRRAIDRELATTPAAALITLGGLPGLDAQGVRALAKSRLSSQVRSVAKLAKEGRFGDAIPGLEEVLRLQRAAGDTSGAPGAYQLLIVALQRTHQHGRAVDAQAALLKFLEEGKQSDKTKKQVVAARLELGTLMARAKDFDAATATLRAAVTELEAQEDTPALASAWRKIAEVEKERLDFQRAAEAYERAIALYQSAGVFSRKDVPAEAIDVLRQAGAVYLNRLSDTLRARAAFERVLAASTSKEIRAATQIDLARVARRRGEFEAAALRAEEARTLSREIKRSDLELDATIEATNVAWYRGDWARGMDLCRESLTLAERNLKTARADRLRQTRGDVERLIFATSVCGLLEMSTGSFEQAERTLLSAVRLAKSIDNASEEAAQYNNLGRVYLEFGRLDRAIASFSRARQIDRRLNDRFGLAYDLRNLGTAQVAVRQDQEAEGTLSQALELSRAVQDANNELRALFALGELARRRGEREAAEQVYGQALPLAQKLENRELAWQIHRGLGLIAQAAGDVTRAEAELRRAVQVARSLSGRASPSDFGPHRYAAFDDLMLLLLEGGRTEEAFGVAELARGLAQTELLDDQRVKLARADVPELIARVRQARTATGAEAALALLRQVEPRIASRLTPADPAALAPRIPEDAAVVIYRVTDDALVIFTLDRSGLAVDRVERSSEAIGVLIERYREGLHQRADVRAASRELSELLLAPIRARLEGKQRLVLVLQGALHYVAFPALPLDGEEQLVDRWLLLQALDARSAALALTSPQQPLSALPIVAIGGGGIGRAADEAPLDFASKELDVIREEHPRAELLRGDRASKAALLAALSRPGGVVHFAGHTRLTGPDPLSGELRTSGEPLRLFEVLSSPAGASLVVLSACETRAVTPLAALDGRGAADEVLSLAESFQLAGARSVLATTMRVSDVSAALLMKRFYRAARTLPPAEALREAQRAVRAYEPHPAWWATFSLLTSE